MPALATHICQTRCRWIWISARASGKGVKGRSLLFTPMRQLASVGACHARCALNFAITSKAGGDFVGVCFADFYIPETDRAVRGLESKTTVRSENGLTVLLREVPSWEVQQWPYLPVHFLREKSGDLCYLVPSAFGAKDELPQFFKHASSLEELAEPAVPH